MPRPKVLGEAKRKMVSLPTELAAAVEDYRFNQRLKTEAEAIRQLIEKGLSVSEQQLAAGKSRANAQKRDA